MMFISGCPTDSQYLSVISEKINADQNKIPIVEIYYGSEKIDAESDIAIPDLYKGQENEITLRIVNSGTGDLTLKEAERINMTGPNAAECYLLIEPKVTVVAGDSSEFTLQIAPMSLGSFSVTITIQTEAEAAGTLTYDLSGQVIEPPQAGLKLTHEGNEISSDSSFTLPGMIVNTSYTHTFVIENTGSKDLVLADNSRLELSGTNADMCTIWSNPDKIIKPGNTTNFEIKIFPEIVGAFSMNLVIHTADENIGTISYEIAAAIDAEPTPQIQVLMGGSEVSNPVDFGDVTIDSTKTIDFQIKNIGTADLHLTGSPYVDVDGNGYSCTQQPSSDSIVPGNSQSFQLAFSPTVVQQYLGSFQILSDSESDGSLNINLTGNGTDLPTLVPVAPSISGGTYYTAQTVTLTHPEPGVTIYYSLHPVGGAVSFSEYPSDYDIEITGNRELHAYATKSGYHNSGTIEETYTLKVYNPGISPADGTVGPPPLEVTFTCSTAGADIYYTTDGSIPTTSDEGPVSSSSSVTIPEIEGSTNTWNVRARAYKAGWTESNTSSTHTITVTSTVATPTIEWTNPDNPDEPSTFISKGQGINFECSDSGVDFRYTLDGTTPNGSSPLGSSVTISGYNTTVKVRAYKNNWNPSDTATQEFKIPVYKTGSITFDSINSGFSYNNSLGKYFSSSDVMLDPGDPFHGIPPTMENRMHRYNGSTGDQEAMDNSRPVGGWLFNGSNIVFVDTNESSSTEYSFTGSSMNATGETGGDVPIANLTLIEGSQYLYYIGEAGEDNIWLYNKSTLSRVSTRPYTGVSESVLYADYGGVGNGYLYITAIYETNVYRLNYTCTNEATFSLPEGPTGLKVLESPDGAYVFVSFPSSQPIRIYDENGTYLATIPFIGELTTKKKSYPGSLIVDVGSNTMDFYKINTTVD